MRTTIQLDNELLKEAKAAAASRGCTLGQFVEDSLRETLARRRATRSRKRIVLPTDKGKGLRPGVDLSDSAGLRDIIDGIVAAP